MGIQSDKFTGSHTKRPEPQGIGKFIVEPSDRELKAINNGYKGAFCYSNELPDAVRKAAAIANNIGAKSWTMFPIQDDSRRRLLVEYYNWPETGIYNFEHPFISTKKKFYWWFNAKLPEWWTDPKWKHVAKEYESAYDPRQ